jgi:glycerophosphoryl diester phosphodiesterase
MKIIAHRGASYFEPENTLRAYKRAIEMNADYVEVDVRMSKDKELIIMHDADVSRTTNGKGLVKDLTYDEIRKLDAGYQNCKFWSRKNEIFAGQGENVPTLEEVIGLVKNKIGLVVEIKEPGTESSIIEKIEENNLKNVILTSFFHKTIKNVSKSNFKIDAGIIFVGEPVSVHKLTADANANIIFPSYRYMTEELVKNAKNHDLTIYPWAIDDENIFSKFAEMGVDGIVTNKLIKR